MLHRRVLGSGDRELASDQHAPRRVVLCSCCWPSRIPLSGGRALTVWSGRRGPDARLAGPDGTFRKTAAPQGPTPTPFQVNSTNRELRTGALRDLRVGAGRTRARAGAPLLTQ
ncbi:MAG: hypothetical protein AVDCRST_MAG67-511 [uncultured Solirubrobacteraceae bacterium]|uniref:Uncharacterized protein n=1 Tax=uncultured Solirubrobacteraceae bacterium TaxID=1162706 RepID=A0A6J4RU70_9ACTN|nr:MAG: hypothetical protein AVDCRST_MAG67-511 [uncultured Solirubrobacteraceae bacterium]